MEQSPDKASDEEFEELTEELSKQIKGKKQELAPSELD